MSFALNVMQSLYATNLAYQAQSQMFRSADGMMGLGASMGANASPSQLMSTERMENALRFQGIMGQINFKVASAMQESAAKQQSKAVQSFGLMGGSTPQQ